MEDFRVLVVNWEDQGERDLLCKVADECSHLVQFSYNVHDVLRYKGRDIVAVFMVGDKDMLDAIKDMFREYRSRLKEEYSKVLNMATVN